MKLCIECKYLQDGNICNAPENGISPVNGKPKQLLASECRDGGRTPNKPKCGNYGAYFEQKEEIIFSEEHVKYDPYRIVKQLRLKCWG